MMSEDLEKKLQDVTDKYIKKLDELPRRKRN